MLETDLRSRLLDNTAVAAIVATRVDWTVRPQGNDFPAIVLQQISDIRSQYMGGFDGFRQTRIQIDCFARLKRDCVALREAAIAAVMDEAIEGSTEFLRAFVNNVIDRGEHTDTGFVHRDMIDMTFWHRQVPT